MSNNLTQAQRTLRKLRAKRLQGSKKKIEMTYENQLLRQHKWHQAKRKEQQKQSKAQSERQLLINKLNKNLVKNKKKNIFDSTKETKLKIRASKPYKTAQKIGSGVGKVGRNVAKFDRSIHKKTAGSGVSLKKLFGK